MDIPLEPYFWIALLAPLLLVPVIVYVRKKKPGSRRSMEMFAAGAVTALVAREILRLF